MGDFRDLIPGPEYHGPSDETMIHKISNFGTRQKCLYGELLKQFGTANKDLLDKKLSEMSSKGLITKVVENSDVFIICL